MRTHCLIAVMFMVGACSGASGLSPNQGKTLVTVDGNKITEGDIEFLSALNPRLKSQAATPFGQKQILDNLVEQELPYRESARRGLDKDSKVKAKADL